MNTKIWSRIVEVQDVRSGRKWWELEEFVFNQDTSSDAARRL
jgi:hypothetical protein